MSDAVNAVGTVFQRWSGTAWVTIAEVKSVTGPGMSRDVIEVTSLNSTDGYKEFIAGFRDAGTVGITTNYTRAGYDLFKADFEDDGLQNYQIVLSDADATSIEFEGLVTEMPLTANVGDAITLEATIKVTSSPVIGSGGSESPA